MANVPIQIPGDGLHMTLQVTLLGVTGKPGKAHPIPVNFGAGGAKWQPLTPELRHSYILASLLPRKSLYARLFS